MLRYIALLMLLLPVACSSSTDTHETHFIMGTLVEFTIANADKQVAEKAIAAAAGEMQRIEDTFTIYGDQPNVVKAFNASVPGTLVSLPDEVASLLRLALTVKKQSHGAFDPALGKLNLLWGFSTDPPAISPPPKTAIAAAIPPEHCIQQRGSQWIRLDARCQLDFGGIAKGYAIDRGIDVLKQHGIHHALINAGGDIRLIGKHGDRPWHIGIRHPRNKNDVLADLQLQGDVSIVTSGDYERFYFYQGKRYHHLLNPQTGWPAMAAQSVTVIADSAALADAWSTALFIQGKVDPALNNHIHIKTLIVDKHGTIRKTRTIR